MIHALFLGVGIQNYKTETVHISYQTKVVQDGFIFYFNIKTQISNRTGSNGMVLHQYFDTEYKLYWTNLIILFIFN